MRGLNLEGILQMELGQVVDYVIEYNNIVCEQEKESERPRRRKATQADIDSFFSI